MKREFLIGAADIFHNTLSTVLKSESDVMKWMSVLESILMKCIEKQSVFSVDMFMLIWKWRSTHTHQNKMEQCALWKVICEQLSQILHLDNLSLDSMGWKWFTQCIQFLPVYYTHTLL